MRSGTWNLLFGLVAVAFGYSGGFVLMGTNSSKWLIVAGAVLAVIGAIQLARSKPR